MIYRIDETTSTNDEARDAKYRHGDIVWAERQTAGRGQRGHTWTSPEGENLTRWCSNPGSFPSGSSSCSPKP